MTFTTKNTIKLGTFDREDALFLRHLLKKATGDVVDKYRIRLRGRGQRAKVAKKKGYNAFDTLRVADSKKFAVYMDIKEV